ncbi:MAG: MarR family winged helix-turn-helix transcriptional regulator [Thermofilaceae archaeon]
MEELSGLLHEVDLDLLNPKRFAIVSLLYAIGPMSLRELRRTLNLTWGDLDSNIRRLHEKGYVRLWRGLGSGPRILEVKAELTEAGIREYEKLAQQLSAVLRKVEEARKLPANCDQSSPAQASR